jgi:phosphoglycerate dehydrogenase-like enzyme
MIAKEQIQKMQKGAYLINAARGNVIVGKDVAEALESGHLAGAAVDVFDVEPEDNGKNCFKNVLQNRTNTILTPHVRNLTFNLVRLEDPLLKLKKILLLTLQLKFQTLFKMGSLQVL